MPAPPYYVVSVALVVGVLSACSRPPAEPSGAGASQSLPFDHQPGSGGISPSQSLIPLNTQLPEGTSIAVRLQSPLSSRTARTGDRFEVVVDQPVDVDGLTLLANGTSATGRVLEARPASSSGPAHEDGYLRLVLVSLNVGGRTVMIETSSIFAKGGSHEERNPSAGSASVGTQKDIVLGIDRHLNFRLAQTVDLKQP